MNGITLLVLLTMFGQVGAAGPATTGSTERDYGWQVSPEDGALEYIVQISPQKAAQMQTGQWENSSDMPPQLVGRATRILVRIGDAVLPRTPSLAEIESRMPRYNSAADLNAALGPGRVSDVESVVNVQGGNLPALPSNPGGMSQPNVIDQAAQAAPSRPSLSSQFLNDSRNAGNSTASGFPAAPSGLPSTSVPFPNSKFKDTAPVANNAGGLPSTGGAVGGGLTGSAAQTGNQNWQGASGGRIADNRGLPGYGSEAGLPANNWSNFSDPQSLNYAANGQNGSQTGTQNSTGFGVPPGGQFPGRSLSEALQQNQTGYGGGGYANNGYGNNRNAYGAGNYGGGNYSNSANQPGPRGGNFTGEMNAGNANIDRLAGLPATGGVPAVPKADNEKSASDDAQSKAAAQATASDNFLQVFFLLSLVVNFYLAMLIRKLLTRYRSLLSSVRSQTA